MAKKNPTSQRIRPKDRIDSFWVMINLGMPRYWKVTTSGIEKSSAPSENQGPVLTFDDTSDFRFYSSKKVTASDARSHFLTEFQEKCRVFSSSPNVYYGTPVTRINQFEHTLFPGAYYIDQLVTTNKVELDQDRVVGFNLQVGGPDEFNIVVLYARRPSGEMSAPQVALNPPDLNLTIREFAEQFKATDEDPILYKVEDILGLQIGPGYPVEELMLGTSVRTVKKGIATLLGVATLGSAAVSGFYYTNALSIAADAKIQQQKTIALNKSIEQMLEQHVHAYARMNSVKTDDMFKYAEILWNRYSLVTNAHIDRQKGVLTAYIPVQEVEKDNSGSATQRLNDFSEIKKQLDRQLDPGLTRAKTTITQDTNAYKVEYNFQSLDRDFSAVAGAK